MSNIFIIHGIGGTPEENWFPWLKNELENLGHNVIAPQFPNANNPNLSEWFEYLNRYQEFLDPSTIWIGHSLGATFILSILEEYPAKAAFLVAGFLGKIGEQFDDRVETFAQKEFDWVKIKKNCPHFTIFSSDNDPYLQPEKAEELAENLGTKVILIKNGGHFNKSAGYGKFEELLKSLALHLKTL